MKLKFLPLILLLAVAAPGLQASDKKVAPQQPDPKIHPKVFSFIEGWLSDGESPVVTEINLDAVDVSGNQFQSDEVKKEDEWVRSPNGDGGFMRYRFTEHRGNHYKVVYQSNGGGSLTTAATIEFSVEKRDVKVDGKAKTIRVLKVLSYGSKT
ncbi:MAG TPA: hypothetical protein VK961_22055 [Chthoniobacter sp.]|nr:hypothetical protein [Chthoniobacter sp.]